MKDLNSITHFKTYTTVYELIMTVGMLIILIMILFIRESQVEIQASQIQMQKDYITKEYLYNFYITVDQIKAIENERPKYLERVARGESRDSVSADFIDYVDLITRLRTRGL